MEDSLGSNICRCCSSEGAFKDLNTKFRWMGEEEVYGEMLKEALDITLSVAPEGEDGGICEVCITQLRNASNFRKQVLLTEESFQKQLQKKAFKADIVKIEEDDGDSDRNMSEDYSEYEVPVKEEPEENKPKKRAAAKTASPRAKKLKSEEAETSKKRVDPKVTIKSGSVASKINLTTTAKPKTIVPNAEKRQVFEKHLDNIWEVLQCTNATLIRLQNDKGYRCYFCNYQHLDPSNLKTHNLEAHAQPNKKDIKMKNDACISKWLIKLDISDLKCTLCEKNIEYLEQIFSHLKAEHKKNIHIDIKDQIIPIKFDGESLRCFICTNVFNNLRSCVNHMNQHYRNFTCDVCEKGFVNSEKLKTHQKFHYTGVFPCPTCKKVFKTLASRKTHESHVHRLSNQIFKCGHCDLRFSYLSQKTSHLNKVHGIGQTYKCLACDKVFHRRQTLYCHTRRFHLGERKYECKHCDMKFFERKELNDHLITHTGVREFQCEVCKKWYGRSRVLVAHMRIHTGDRRFKCEVCDQAFVQKCAWQAHMKSKHDVE